MFDKGMDPCQEQTDISDQENEIDVDFDAVIQQLESIDLQMQRYVRQHQKKQLAEVNENTQSKLNAMRNAMKEVKEAILKANKALGEEIQELQNMQTEKALDEKYNNIKAEHLVANQQNGTATRNLGVPEKTPKGASFGGNVYCNKGAQAEV